MNNFIDDKIYNTYFGIQTPESGESTAPEENQFVYADNKSAKVHTNETVSDTDYQLQTFRHVADDNIDDLEHLAEILKRLCNAAWGQGWGELSPDLKKGENSSEIIVPQITLDINTRDIAEGIGGLKPTLVDIVKETDDIILISSDGTIIRLAVKDVSVLGRNTQGVTLMRMPEGVQLVSIAKVTDEEEEIEEN